MGAPRLISIPRRLFFGIVACGLFLLLVEGVLRLAGSVVAHRHRPGELTASEVALEVWAFGDSYTFGVGADEPSRDSYPAVVGRVLEERVGRPVRVRNLARPGMNSTRIVALLEAEAARADAGEVAPPDLVLLLAGVNNTRWLGQSGRFCLDEGTPRARAPAGMRELRLYKLMRHALLRERPPRPADVACRAVADGFQHLDDGRPDSAEERFAAALVALPESRWAHVGSGIAAGRMGRHATAVEHFEAAGSLGALSPALPLARAFALRSAGRIEAARAALEAFGELDGDLREAAWLLEARLLHDEGRFVDAETFLLGLLPEAGRVGGGAARFVGGGAVPFVLDGIGWARWARGDVKGAAEAFSGANEAGRPLHITPHLLGWSHLGEALTQVVEGDAPRRVLDSLELARRDSSAAGASLAVEALVRAGRSCAEAAGPVEASLAVVEDFPLALWVRAACSTAEVDHLAPAAELLLEHDLPDLRALPTPAVQQWFDPTDTALITSDLERALERIRSLGARSVLLTYPQPAAHDEIADAVLRLGARTGVTVVDPRGSFDAAHFDEGRPWHELLIPDGHPTTAGYLIMGDLVAAAVASP